MELHERNEISEISSSCYHKVDYFPNFNCEQVPPLLNCGYDYLILDLGSLSEANKMEFLRCDKKLILGSLAPWKIRSYEQLFSVFPAEKTLVQSFSYFVQTGDHKTVSDFSKSHNITMQHIPFIKNPFRIEKEHFSFLQDVVS